VKNTHRPEPPKCVLRIANIFTIESAGEGDCFFNLFVQGLNQLSVPGGQFNIKSLRQACFACAKVKKDSDSDSQSE